MALRKRLRPAPKNALVETLEISHSGQMDSLDTDVLGCDFGTVASQDEGTLDDVP